MATASEKIIAFGWYGGKYSHLNWLLPLLPQTMHYCEPFGGSAAVLVNRAPAAVETYNDIDGQVANFFRVLRDQKDALIEAIGLTPFSREEFRLAIEDQAGDLSDLERARRFFVRARQVRTGLAQTASEGRWANCVLTSRAGMAGAVSRWLGSVEGLAEIAQRLLRVQIENDAAVNVIRRYDSPETLFYCDPPYVHESRADSNAYAFEMTDEDHRALAAVLHQVQGKVALSGYHCKLMDELYSDWNWVAAPTKKAHSTNTGADNNKQDRTEILWVNYALPSAAVQAAFNVDREATTDKWNGPKQSSPTLFDRSRLAFLETYQQLVLDEPESAVSQPLKEAFLTLRRLAEYDADR